LIDRIELARVPEFRLGALIVRPGVRQVARDDDASEVLEPRVMQVLVALAQADGAILTRDDLTEACWDGRIVGEDAINRVLSRLRRVQEGIGLDSFRIETITKVGYRLVPRNAPPAAAPVPVAPAAIASSPALVPGQRSRSWMAIAAGLIAVALLGAAWLLWERNSGDRQKTVTVQAVDARADDGAAQLFRQGLSTDLARVVVGNDATLAISDQPAVPARPADLLVTGEARTSGGLLHVNIRLVGSDRTILWSSDFARSVAEVDDLRQEVAARIADVLLCALGAQGGGMTLDLPTLRLYLSGCEQRHEHWQESAALFRKVVDRRPDFAPAWAQLASRTALYANTLDGADRDRGIADAIDYAHRALALNPGAGAAYFALAHTRVGMANWIGRQVYIDQGLKAGAVHAPLFNDAAIAFSAIGRGHAALEYARRAVATDPFGRVFTYNLSGALGFYGHPDDSEALLRKTQQFWPHDPLIAAGLFTLRARVGDARQALAMIDDPALTRLYSTRAIADWRLFLEARIAPGSPAVARAIAAFRAAAATAPLDDQREDIQHLVQLGDVDGAFTLANALPQLDIQDENIWFQDFMAPLRAEPRFMRIAARQGIAAIWLKTGLWPDFCVNRAVRYDCRAEARRALGLKL